jgi:Phosphodiester glycosidase
VDTSRYLRSGVCVSDSNHVYFAISDETDTLKEFAVFLRDGLGCSDALYLDGAISELWAKDLDRPPPAKRDFGGLLTVEPALPARHPASPAPRANTPRRPHATRDNGSAASRHGEWLAF